MEGWRDALKIAPGRKNRTNSPGIQLAQLTGLAWIPACVIPARRSAVPESHLFWMCLSLGDSGLPLRGNRNDSPGAGTYCVQVV